MVVGKINHPESCEARELAKLEDFYGVVGQVQYLEPGEAVEGGFGQIYQAVVGHFKPENRKKLSFKSGGNL